ncbi:hypothetical protein ACFV2N_47980 [Streptomyces sp. NPDC059680]|uniref:hypothetical protein n=1 Tax=Streptomyces sp. NPDC059680 TaxID=3346904 RepID=UPI0036AB511C
MAHTMRSAAQYEAGNKWLAECSDHPELARLAWSQETLAPIISDARPDTEALA